MKKDISTTRSDVMTLAWQFIKRNGFSRSEALRVAWKNVKVRTSMHEGIVKFYFIKVDGTRREAYGTLAERLIPAHTDGQANRKKNDTIQVYFDTEKMAWRSFKKANLVTV